MITLNQIESYVENQGSVVKEIFSSVVTTKSPSTRKSAAAICEVFCEKILNDHPELINAELINSATRSSVREVAESFSVEEFHLFAERISESDSKTLRGWLTTKTPLWRLNAFFVCFLFDLNYNRFKALRKSNRDAYMNIGDGIALAGLYLAIQEG